MGRSSFSTLLLHQRRNWFLCGTHLLLAFLSCILLLLQTQWLYSLPPIFLSHCSFLYLSCSKHTISVCFRHDIVFVERSFSSDIDLINAFDKVWWKLTFSSLLSSTRRNPNTVWRGKIKGPGTWKVNQVCRKHMV